MSVRKAPNYFAGKEQVICLRWSTFDQSWEVGFCAYPTEMNWRWRKLHTARVGPKLEREAKDAVALLICDAAERFMQQANILTAAAEEYVTLAKRYKEK